MARPAASAARRAFIVVAAGIVIAADQASKTWALHHTTQDRHVLGPLWFTLTFNKGAAFSLGAGVAPVIEAVVIMLVVALILFGGHASRQARWSLVGGLGLLVGGAASNLIDRVVRNHHGAVIDFVDAVRIGHHDYWPVFNVADASVVVGAIVVALSYSAGRR